MIDRPPFILAFAGDSQGCGFHRIMMPLASLVEAGVADGRIDLAIWPDEFIVACAPDVIVWQRQVEDGQVEAMRRLRKQLPNTLFIYELDDYLDDIPPTSFHASFMPTDIKTRIARALVHCDRISTTTEPLAHWLQTLAPPGTRVDVIPNALPVARLRERKARSSGKLRIGFAGGISHAGDIAILRPAMEAIGDEVTWVFFGMNMEDPPTPIEYHDGVPATLYLDKMASLDLDLMLAPLDNNPFNLCKSNLRLIESAAIGAAVIAQDLPPYRVHSPPVFAYSDTPESWITTIRQFISASRSERQRSADQLRTWAGRHYTLERLLTQRMEAWLPEVSKPWQPRRNAIEQREKTVVACQNIADVQTRMPFLMPLRKVTEGLEAACHTALTVGADVLWLRPTTAFDEQSWNRVRKLLNSSKDYASAVPLASDGANGFPQESHWTPLQPAAVAGIAKLTVEQFGDRSLLINAPTGPVICLSIRAIAALGIPDVAGCDGNEEQAILEWGLRASTRTWKHVQALGAFAGSTSQPAQPTQTAVLRVQARGLGEYLSATKPESLLTKEERAQLEIRLLRSQWGGPRPGSSGFENSYPVWSTLRRIQQENLKVGFDWTDAPAISINQFGSEKTWTDDAYVVFVDDSVVLQDAVYWFNRSLGQKHKHKPLVLYGDNDTIAGDKASPEFKPDFDFTLFLAQDYVTPVCAVHASLLATVPKNRIELFSIILDAAIIKGSKVFYHVPHVLGSIEIKSEPETIALETLERQLVIERALGDKVKVTASRQIMGCLTVSRDWRTVVKEPPLVSIVIPTLGSGRLIQPCVATILQHTAYPNYEIIVVQNGLQRTQPEVSDAILADPRVRIVYYDEPFHWSKINNWAIRVYSLGEYIVTMNDDICVGSKQWLDAMMGYAVLPTTGVVGAKLCHPMGVIQHIGVICHKGIAGHMHKGLTLNQAGHLGRAILSHEAVAVTGACMLFSRASFDDVNGFDTSLSHNYNDTVFCATQYKRGRVNIVETAAELMHPEASSRPESSTPEGQLILIHDNEKLMRLHSDPDPYWNSNMALIASPDGLLIQGLNADILAWDDFIPDKYSPRILLINDKPGTSGMVLDILRENEVPFLADLSGFTLRLISPGPVNIQPWDIRDSDRMAEDLKMLGIDKIILRSLVGMSGAAPPVETLRTLTTDRLGIPVEVKPLDFALIAPWLVEDGRLNEQKTFGWVDIAAWKTAYETAMGEV